MGIFDAQAGFGAAMTYYETRWIRKLMEKQAKDNDRIEYLAHRVGDLSEQIIELRRRIIELEGR